MAVNERNAGRKPVISAEKLEELQKRHEAGEAISALAKEVGVSRQTLSGYLNKKDETAQEIYRTYRAWARLNRKFRSVEVSEYTMRMDFMCKDECCTVILVNFKDREIAIQNETDDVLHRAFGVKVRPTWEDFEEFLESRCFPRTREGMRMILKDLELDAYDPLAIVEKTNGRMAEDFQWLKISYLVPEEAAI